MWSVEMCMFYMLKKPVLTFVHWTNNPFVESEWITWCPKWTCDKRGVRPPRLLWPVVLIVAVFFSRDLILWTATAVDDRRSQFDRYPNNVRNTKLTRQRWTTGDGNGRVWWRGEPDKRVTEFSHTKEPLVNIILWCVLYYDTYQRTGT